MANEFKIKVRTRHPSQKPLRDMLPSMNVRSVVRFGSTTPTEEVYPKFFGKRTIVEVNTPNAVSVSANKLLMKQAFTDAGVTTSDWWVINGDVLTSMKVAAESITFDKALYPIVAKHIFGSRGTGNTLLKSKGELENFLKGKDLSKYIFEKYYAYNREYRLHMTSEGCFYTCRKMLKSGAKERWFRNSENSVWILEENPLFDKPTNWDSIVADCVKALNAVGLDFGALDVRVQSAKDNDGNVIKNPKWIIIETNSAPGLEKIGLAKYVEEIPKIINRKNFM